MYDYVTTKPELNEETLSEFGITIQHGYLKDAAAKVHKYISRKKNAAGKWIYTYFKPRTEDTITDLETGEVRKVSPDLFSKELRSRRKISIDKNNKTYRKVKNLYERGKRNIGLKTGKYSPINEDWVKTNKNYMQKIDRDLQRNGKGRVIVSGPTNKKPYLHFQDNVTDNARTSHYDKHSKFERQSGYAMNNDPRYKKAKKKSKKSK